MKTSVIEQMNSLLRGELAAVAAYQHAVRSLVGKVAIDAVEIMNFASEHQRTVAALQAAVRTLGGVPAVEASTWGAFALLRDTASIRSLLEGEAASLAGYRAVLPSLHDDAHELVEFELIPRQNRHVAALSVILEGLSS